MVTGEAERNGKQLDYNWFEYTLGGTPVRFAAPGRIELEADPEVERIAAVLFDVMDDYELTRY